MTAVYLRWVVMSALVVVAPSALHAQLQARLDVATGDVRFRGQAGAGALVLAPTVEQSAAGFRVWTAGQFALSNTGSARSNLETMVTTRKPLLLGLAPLLMVRGQDDPLARDVRNRRVDGSLGLRIGTPRFGASVGVGLARSVHGSTNRAVQTSSANIHLARGAFQLRIGYAGNAFDAPDAMRNSQAGFSLARTRLSDVTSDASWKFRGVELGGFVGRRVGGGLDHGRAWGGGFASLAINDQIALVARQETAPSDPTRHLAAQRIATIGFRIRPRLARARFDDGSDAAQFRREFQLTRVVGDQHGIRVYLPGASTVELAGSFNQWTPTGMRSAGRGWWHLTVPLAAGLHSLNVRADGGSWMVPPGLESSTDEFNGTVGVLLIA